MAGQLALGAGTLKQDPLGVAQGAFGVQVFTAKLRSQLAQPSKRVDLLLRTVTDELPLAPIAQGAPVVFLKHPARLATQKSRLVMADRARLNQVAKQTGNAQHVFEPRTGITDA
ncbi:hypothetical protein D3C72_1379970 [compost metagenome]